jgi:hypothetical protein
MPSEIRLAFVLTLHDVKNIEPDAVENNRNIDGHRRHHRLGFFPRLVRFVGSAFDSSSFLFCPAGALLLMLITVAFPAPPGLFS